MFQLSESWTVTPVKINNIELKRVSQFKYLGGIISEDGSMKLEIEQRLKIAMLAFNKYYSQVYNNSVLAVRTKINTLKTMMIPCLTYGCASWHLKLDQTMKLEGFHYRCLMKITNTKWGDMVSYVTLLEKTESMSIRSIISKNRLKHIGKIQNTSNHRIPKFVLHGEVEAGAREPGRPIKCLRQCIKDDLRKCKLLKEFEENVLNDKAWIAMVNEGIDVSEDAFKEQRIAASNKRKARS